jgi:hypothetical protein
VTIKKPCVNFYIVFKTIYEGIGDFWRREQVRWRCRTISLERKKINMIFIGTSTGSLLIPHLALNKTEKKRYLLCKSKK